MDKRRSPESIKKKKLLLVEGKDEKIFFEELFKHMTKEDIVEVHDVAGKDNFKKDMPTFVITPGFNDVETIAIVRDADDSCTSAFQSVEGVLKENSFLPPERPGEFSQGNPKMGVFIMPDNINPGMLENLCLETVKEKEGMECVNRFIDCANQLENPPKNRDIAKAKVQAFLAIMPGVFDMVGLGAKKGYWDFDSAALKPLKNFLSELMT
ncbi:DUF3226 domain-containing protein [Acidobacteriota bacterium]